MGWEGGSGGGKGPVGWEGGQFALAPRASSGGLFPSAQVRLRARILPACTKFTCTKFTCSGAHLSGEREHGAPAVHELYVHGPDVHELYVHGPDVHELYVHGLDVHEISVHGARNLRARNRTLAHCLILHARFFRARPNP